MYEIESIYRILLENSTKRFKKYLHENATRKAFCINKYFCLKTHIAVCTNITYKVIIAVCTNNNMTKNTKLLAYFFIHKQLLQLTSLPCGLSKFCLKLCTSFVSFHFFAENVLATFFTSFIYPF